MDDGGPDSSTVERIRALLHLEPLAMEGGYYAETYRAAEAIPAEALPARYGGRRSLGTAIYYLLTPDTCSAMHRLAGDELWHFYLGDPLEMLQLHPDGSGQVILLGSDLLRGQRPQVVVPAGTWQGTRLLPGGAFALVGTTMAPGFEFGDYEPGQREVLVQAYPCFRELIMARTRGS